MAGEIPDRELVWCPGNAYTALAPAGPHRARIRFALATERDDAAIRHLLRANPMRGKVSLTFEREPLVNLALDGELMAYRHTGFWHPMDSSRDHKYLNDLHATGEAPWVMPEQAGAVVNKRLAA